MVTPICDMTPSYVEHDSDYRVANMKMCDMTLATRLLHIRDYHIWQDSIHLNTCVTLSYWWLPPRTEELELKTITTPKISNKFPRQSPYISTTFSRESPKSQTLFQLSKRSPRHSKDQAGKLIDFEIWKFISLISSVSRDTCEYIRGSFILGNPICARTSERVMSRICHVAYRSPYMESSIYGIMTWLHIWSHVALHMSYDMSYESYERSHVAQWRSHVKDTKESCHTHESVISRVWKSYVTHMKESCHTYKGVMSIIRHSQTHTHTHTHPPTHTHSHTHLAASPQWADGPFPRSTRWSRIWNSRCGVPPPPPPPPPY